MGAILLHLSVLSAAQEQDEIVVEREADGALVVRSPMSQGNFLFRAPAAFREATPPEGFAACLEARDGEATARIRLRLGKAAGASVDAFVKAREGEYRAGVADKPDVPPQHAPALVRCAGAGAARTVLVVLDGPRSYELFLDAAPPGSGLAGKLDAVATGFTILDPKGPPPAVVPTGETAEETVIEHDYYRLKVVKPAGFEQRPVDPDADKGIFLHLHREDDEKNVCDIRIRVHLSKTVAADAQEIAAKAIEAFASKYPPAKVPKRPSRTGWPGADAAFKCKMAGKVSGTGAVVEEEWRVIDHSNDRLYEVQVTLFARASRAFKKDLQTFWRGLKIAGK